VLSLYAGNCEDATLDPAAGGFSKESSKVSLRCFQAIALLTRQVLARAIDVKVKHRHCGSKWAAFAVFAPFGGAFQGLCNLGRLLSGKNTTVQIQSVACLRDAM
jgi:hypothetical protein